jgi:hypothetical protein
MIPPGFKSSTNPELAIRKRSKKALPQREPIENGKNVFFSLLFPSLVSRPASLLKLQFW